MLFAIATLCLREKDTGFRFIAGSYYCEHSAGILRNVHGNLLCELK